MNPQGDELMLLWRQGTMGEPDPEEVARLAGRASMKRFDKVILRRNLAEYLAGVLLLIVFGWRIVAGENRLQNIVSIGCVAFVLVYLWWQHRHITPLDPAADASAYSAAMIARIDHQIRLLKGVRYWYLLPLYVPPVWQVFNRWQTSPAAAIVGFVVVTAAFVFVGFLNERVGVARLNAERDKIEALYKE